MSYAFRFKGDPHKDAMEIGRGIGDGGGEWGLVIDLRTNSEADAEAIFAKVRSAIHDRQRRIVAQTPSVDWASLSRAQQVALAEKSTATHLDRLFRAKVDAIRGFFGTDGPALIVDRFGR